MSRVEARPILLGKIIEVEFVERGYRGYVFFGLLLQSFKVCLLLIFGLGRVY
jgi:hypothetical protein